MSRRLPIQLLIFVLIAAMALLAGCNNDNPTQSRGRGLTDSHTFSEPNTNDSPDVLYGRAATINQSSSVIVMQHTQTEVIVDAGASVAEKDVAANTLIPSTMATIHGGDSLELRGVWLSHGSGGAIGENGTKGNQRGETPVDDPYSPPVFLASQVTVMMGDSIGGNDTTIVPNDSFPIGTRLQFRANIKEIDLTAGTITFHSWLYTGQTTASTQYFGMFMGPIITLANFAPGMWVEVVGRTTGNWGLTVDSLTQLSDTPPDTTNPPDTTQQPDTLPLGIPISFDATIWTVSDADSIVRFYGVPWRGQVTPNTEITILSFMICGGLEGCLTEGMRVSVSGLTAGDWKLNLTSLTELGVPPDSTNPPDSGQYWSGFDIIKTLDLTRRIVTFEQFNRVGVVLPDAYLTGEFPPNSGDLLPYFTPGTYVYLYGKLAGPDTILISSMSAQDILPPDTTNPPDTTWPDSSLLGIPDGVFFDVESVVYPNDSIPGERTYVHVKIETKSLEACPNSIIMGTIDLQATGANFLIRGIPPYECFAYEPGPAKQDLWLGFDDETFTLTFTYKQTVETWTVTVSGDEVTVTPQGTNVWSTNKNL